MENTAFTIYKNPGIYDGGGIKDDCLYIDSEISGADDFPDSERHYRLSKDETAKLLSTITLDRFIELCKSEGLIGMEEFFNSNGITYSIDCF